MEARGFFRFPDGKTNYLPLIFSSNTVISAIIALTECIEITSTLPRKLVERTLSLLKKMLYFNHI